MNLGKNICLMAAIPIKILDGRERYKKKDIYDMKITFSIFLKTIEGLS